MVSRPTALAPPQSDLKTVVETRNREWHFHIYFLLQSPTETAAALALRDAILRLRHDGEFPERNMLNNADGLVKVHSWLCRYSE